MHSIYLAYNNMDQQFNKDRIIIDILATENKCLTKVWFT